MHPVQVDVDYVEGRSRLTTFFRAILVIPHLVFLMLFGIVAYVVTFIAWWAILIVGRYPVGMWNLTASWLRLYARVMAYFWLVSDPYPPFSGDGDYPVSARLERPERQSRLKTLFRIILVIPAYIISYLLNIALQVVGFILWLVIVITGKSPLGLHNFQLMCLRYNVRFTAYVLLLVDAYPSFEEPAGEQMQVQSQTQPAV
jgi:hypothetical protein